MIELKTPWIVAVMLVLFAGVFAAPASAATIGQVGGGDSAFRACQANFVEGGAGASYTVQAPGTIDSFSFDAIPANINERLRPLVLRPSTTLADTFVVVNQPSTFTIRKTGLNTFNVTPIAVQNGDIIGFQDITNVDNCHRVGFRALFSSGPVANRVHKGDSVLLSNPIPGIDLNLSAHFTPSAAAGTSCTGTIAGKSIPGNVVVPSNRTCTLANDTIGGNVTVNRGATLTVQDSTIAGNLTTAAKTKTNLNDGTRIVGNATIQGTSFSVACHARIDGNETIKNLGADPAVCGPIGGNLSLLNNRGDIFLSNAIVGGNLIVRGNSNGSILLGGFDVAGSGSVTNNTSQVSLNGNSFGGNLNCSGNTPPPNGSGNRAQGSLNGQCATLG